MTSPFLSSGGTDLTALQDGTFPLNVASVAISDAVPSMPLRTDASRKVISGLIGLADCSFTPIVNPLGADLDLADFAITDAKECQFATNASPTTPPTDGLTVYTSGDKLRYKDDTAAVYQVATIADIAASVANYLLKSGGTMTGVLDMNTHTIESPKDLRFSTYVSGTGVANAGCVALYSNLSKLRYWDDTKTSFQVATTADIAAAVAAYLLKAGGTMAGPIDMGTYGLTNVGSVAGPTNSRTADNIVSNPGTATVGRIAVFTSDKVIQDGNASIGDLLSKSGGSMSGDIDMKGHDLKDVGEIDVSGTYIRPTVTDTTDLGSASLKFKNAHLSGTIFSVNSVSSAPAVFSGVASGGPFIVSFTAATAKLVATATLTELNDPSGSFTPVASTGAAQYTGATRYFQVRILYNILGAASAQTYTAWVSKNGSLTPVAPRAMNFTTATPVGYLPYEVSNIYQLATNDTVQLAAQYSATANVNIFDIQVQIIPIA